MKMTKEEYLLLVIPCSEEVEKKYKIAKIISLSQSAHESNFGNSELAKQAKNFFGIKATQNWIKKGGKVWFGKTTEFVGGKELKITDGFRMYDTILESFIDWAEIISNLGIYQKAYQYAQMGLVDKYGEEITGKYATDPRYKEKLIKVSEVVKSICEKLGYEI